MAAFDYDRSRRRAARGNPRAEEILNGPRRRRRAHPDQHERIRKLAEELGRESWFLPEMAYDARLEIERLTLMADRKRREVK